MRFTAFRAAALLVLSGATAQAQRVRGLVTDSATGAPVAGVVVVLLDSAGASIARNLSDQAGTFVFPPFTAARRLRALRIGYRPQELGLSTSEDSSSLSVVMAPLPRMLEPVRSIVSAKCEGGNRTLAALALLDQARGALLASIVARETRPASMVLIGYRRSYDRWEEDESELVNQVLRIDSLDARPRTYEAVKTPEGFMTSGFGGNATLLRAGVGGVPELLAPDAETLMSDEFSSAYCFEIADDDKNRPAQVGIKFRRPDQTRRLDLEGVMWVDTAARVLRDVEFEYVNEFLRRRPRSSGRIHFRAFPNGVVLIDDWQISEIRLSAQTGQTLSTLSRGAPISRTTSRPTLWTAGGTLASARWADGSTFALPLGKVRVDVRSEDGKTPVPGMYVRLDGTPYVMRSDSAGTAVFDNVFPTVYAVAAYDTLLTPYAIGTRPQHKLRVTPNTVASVAVAGISAFDHVAQRCRRDKRLAGENFLFGRVLDADNRPVRDALVAVTRRDDGDQWTPLGRPQKTAADGFWFLCDAGVRSGSDVRAVATRFDQTASGEAQVQARVTIFDLRIP